jgi:hypothetical protein
VDDTESAAEESAEDPPDHVAIGGHTGGDVAPAEWSIPTMSDEGDRELVARAQSGESARVAG